jgi:DNA repair exonuclease SbcCD ATPase subunit
MAPEAASSAQFPEGLSSDSWRPLGSERWNQSLSPPARAGFKVLPSVEEDAPSHLRNFLQTPSSLAQSSPVALNETMHSEVSAVADQSLTAGSPQDDNGTVARIDRCAIPTKNDWAGRTGTRNDTKTSVFEYDSFQGDPGENLSPTSSPSENNPPLMLDCSPEAWRFHRSQRGAKLPSLSRQHDHAGGEQTPRPYSPPTPPSVPTPHAAIRQMEQEIERLKKQNFNLKLRIYFLEEALAAAGIDYRAIDGAHVDGAAGTNDDRSLSQSGLAEFGFDSIRVELEAKEERLKQLREELEERIADIEERDELLQTARDAIMGLQQALEEAQARLTRAEQQPHEATERDLSAKRVSPAQELDAASLPSEALQDAVREALKTAEETFRLKIQSMENEMHVRDEHIQHLENELDCMRARTDDEIRSLQEELQAALRDRDGDVESARALMERERLSDAERIGTLETQLGQANERVEQLSADLKRYQELLAESEERQGSLKQAIEDMAAKSPLEAAADTELRLELHTLQQRCIDLQGELDAARAEQARLLERLAASETACRHAEQRCHELETAAAESTSDASIRMRRLIEAHEQERRRWHLMEERFRRAEDEHQGQLDNARRALEETQRELVDERRKLAHMELEQTQAQNRADRFQMRMEASQSEIDALRLRVAAAEQERQQWHQELDFCQRERDELAEKLHTALGQVAALEQALQAQKAAKTLPASAHGSSSYLHSPSRTTKDSSDDKLKPATAQAVPRTPASATEISPGANARAQHQHEQLQKQIKQLQDEQAHYQRRCQSLEDAVANRDRRIEQLTVELSQLAERERQLTDQLQVANMHAPNLAYQGSGRHAEPPATAKDEHGDKAAATHPTAPHAPSNWETLRQEIETLRDDILFWREEARLFREEARSLRRLHTNRSEAAARNLPTGPVAKPETKLGPVEESAPCQPDERAWEKALRATEHRLERLMATINRLAQARASGNETAPETRVDPEIGAPRERPLSPRPSPTKSVIDELSRRERPNRQKPLPVHHLRKATRPECPAAMPSMDALDADAGDESDDPHVSREIIHLLRTHQHRRRIEAPPPAVCSGETNASSTTTDRKTSRSRPEAQRPSSHQTWQDAILRQVEETQRVIAATQKRLEHERAAFLRRTQAQAAPRLAEDNLIT